MRRNHSSVHKKKPRRYRAAITVVMTLASIGNAYAQKLDTNEPVTIAIGNEPPFTELKPDGPLSGAGPDIDRAALKQSGFAKFNGQTMAYGAMIPAIQAGRAKMVSSGGLIIKPDRCNAVIFSEPVICNTEAFLVRSESIGRFNGYKQAAALNIRLAVPAGGVQEKNALAAGVKRENLVNFPDSTSAVKMLQDKRVDAVALNDGAILEMQKRSGDPSLKTIVPLADGPIECAAAAFNKRDVALRDAYNAGLKKLIDSGEYNKIMASYGLSENVKIREGAKTTTELCRP
jgi:polar amino acid transport system substrate-binding protein